MSYKRALRHTEAPHCIRYASAARASIFDIAQMPFDSAWLAAANKKRAETRAAARKAAGKLPWGLAAAKRRSAVTPSCASDRRLEQSGSDGTRRRMRGKQSRVCSIVGVQAKDEQGALDHVGGEQLVAGCAGDRSVPEDAADDMSLWNFIDQDMAADLQAAGAKSAEKMRIRASCADRWEQDLEEREHSLSKRERRCVELQQSQMAGRPWGRPAQGLGLRVAQWLR